MPRRTGCRIVLKSGTGRHQVSDAPRGGQASEPEPTTAAAMNSGRPARVDVNGTVCLFRAAHPIASRRIFAAPGSSPGQGFHTPPIFHVLASSRCRAAGRWTSSMLHLIACDVIGEVIDVPLRSRSRSIDMNRELEAHDDDGRR